MKRIALLLISAIFSISALAQSATTEKVDVILKINGEEMKGKITKISDTDLTFIYSGETLEYTVKKSDILKITHASGRIETINQPPLPSDIRKNDQIVMKGSPAEHHNRIAILPFHFLMENQPGADEIGLSAQQDTYAFLAQHSSGYTLIDPRTSNALLAKAGINKENMSSFTMNEIANILGVEYVIDGSVKQNKAAQTSYTSDNANSTVKRNGDDKVTGIKSNGSTFSSAQQRYDISVSLSIYTDTNASIYNESHKAFFSSTDGGFGSPLQYLLKRSPLYRK